MNLSCYYDAKRFLNCIPKNEHIVFVGDSVTRYQYMALAYSVSKGFEMSESEFPSIVKEKEWTDWMEYHKHITSIVNNMQCDCHRSYSRVVGSKTIDNRFFSNKNINLTFFQVLNPNHIQGRWHPLLYQSDSYKKIHNKFDPLWIYNIFELFTKIVFNLQPLPTVIIMNIGIWMHFLKDDYHKLQEIFRESNARFFWKTTTKYRNNKQVDDKYVRKYFNIFDAHKHTQNCTISDYWDNFHFQPWVYNKLNALLLKEIYGNQKQCLKFVHGKCKTFV